MTLVSEWVVPCKKYLLSSIPHFFPDILLDPNEEVLHWLQVMHLHQEYYSLPFDQLDNAEWINQIVEAVGDRGDALHLTTGSNNNNSAEAAGMSLRDTSSDKVWKKQMHILTTF